MRALAAINEGDMRADFVRQLAGRVVDLAVSGFSMSHHEALNL